MNDENRMPPVNSFDEYSIWADSTGFISRLDIIIFYLWYIENIHRGIITKTI